MEIIRSRRQLFKKNANICKSAVLDEESEFTFAFPQKSTDNIFEMASLSVSGIRSTRYMRYYNL